MPRIRHVQRQRPAQAFAGTPASVRNGNRAERVSAALIKAAERGPEMATVIEQELAGLGSDQLKQVVNQMWMHLARKDIHDA